MIPVKIITKEQANKLGLTKTTPIIGGGGGSMNVALEAVGKIGNNKAEKISIINIKTGEKFVLFDKGKKFIFKGFKEKIL